MVASAFTFAMRFWLIRDHPQRVFELTVKAFRARLNETALQLASQIEEQQPWRARLFEVELAAQMLVDSIRQTAGSDLRPEQRDVLRRVPEAMREELRRGSREATAELRSALANLRPGAQDAALAKLHFAVDVLLRCQPWNGAAPARITHQALGPGAAGTASPNAANELTSSTRKRRGETA